jgi:hypothetical protein
MHFSLISLKVINRNDFLCDLISKIDNVREKYLVRFFLPFSFIFTNTNITFY